VTVAHAGRGPGGPWTLAPALIELEAEADRIAPRRSTASDGSIGDAAHAARKSSHHNPEEEGAVDSVDALDITHDPKNGMDIHAHVRAWVARLDPRLEEVISNGQIWTYMRRREGWRPYRGSNMHRTHGHVVVKNSHRNDRSPWFVSVPPFPTKPTPPPYRPPTPPPAPTLTPDPEEDEMAIYVRLDVKKGSHPHAGRIEAVTAMHRRWVPADELALFTFLGGKIVNCPTAKAYNAWTSTKEPVGKNGLRGPI
jgi:hypothetical protein